MAYAVELLLRDDDAVIIDEFWEWVNERDFGVQMDGRPHVTLAVWDTFDMDEVSDWLSSLARDTPHLPLQFASIGIFPNDPSVLFVAPVVSETLLDLQTKIVAELPAAPNTLWTNYRTGLWVPHCTLGMHLDLDACLEATEQAKALPMPFEAMLDRLAVIEIPAIINHLTVKLAG